MDDELELELLKGFRRLGPAARNMVKLVVSTAVTAEDAVRREMGSDVGIPPVEAKAEAEVGSGLTAVRV